MRLEIPSEAVHCTQINAASNSIIVLVTVVVLHTMSRGRNGHGKHAEMDNWIWTTPLTHKREKLG